MATSFPITTPFQPAVPRRAASRIAISTQRLSEAFWFTLCLILFMVLGPFSAPIVLGYVFSTRTSETSAPSPCADADLIRR